jgi:hypothetical protein
MRKNNIKNQEKDYLFFLEDEKVKGYGRTRWLQAGKLGGTKFPRISKG